MRRDFIIEISLIEPRAVGESTEIQSPLPSCSPIEAAQMANLGLLPRIFNTGSPYNVPAGAGADLEHLKAHYEKLNVEAETKRTERLKTQEGENAILTQREADAAPKSALEKYLGITMPSLRSLGLRKPGL